jgi:carbamoyltransferase
MLVLGLSAFFHDSAAVLVEDGAVLCAAQEERFSRRKHDARFPRNAVAYCLGYGGHAPRDIDCVVFYDKPFLKFERLLETYLAFAPRGLRSFAMAAPLWAREKLFQKGLLCRELKQHIPDFDLNRLLFAEHHLSHAASAFFPSPFNEALVLTLDAVGEWATTSVALGYGNRLQIIKEVQFPHSLGLLYSAFTYHAGFKVNSGEYKLMGLAPYGQPAYVQTIWDNLIDVKPDGSFRLDLHYFDYCTGLTMTNGRFDTLFGGPPRRPGEPLARRHMDLAASIQAVLEEIVLRMTRSLAAETGQRNLCLAGGVALNCVANGKILRDGRFEHVWVQPAAGDAGGALGAALAACYLYKGQPRAAASGDSMRGALLGPEFSEEEIEARLRSAGARFRVMDEARLIEACVDALAEEKVLGWFQGRMEFGPRALGARSILADARSPRIQSVLNLKIKRRESFRPLAPSVLREDLEEWFDLDIDSPYMLFTADVARGRRLALDEEQRRVRGLEMLQVARSEIPAVTHVDNSARIQTVHRETNPRYHALIACFKQRTACPVVVNTSFNVRGEPIVCTPEEAFRCFMHTGMDALSIGNCFLRKEEQDTALARPGAPAFEPD